MITLQQTAGNNNQTIWCLRLRGEGSNLVTNGDFANSDGWTLSGDWAIGSGVATYTYVDDATGVLYRTLSAAEAVTYILEYEVTNVSGPFWTLNASDLTVNGGGTYFFASSVKLDSTLGKHSIQLLGNAGGTELRFMITDVGALDTISIDNIKIRKADNIVYLSTKDITLDNAYDGQVLNYENYLSDITYPSSIIGGGGTGSVTSFSFSISRHVSNSNFNSFFNEIYPATDAGFYVSRIVDFGVCWEGATTDTEITWLLRGRIIDYNYEQRKLTFSSFQESELANKEVPYYAVQKDFNNAVSYFTNAPEENYGVPIPIVYGDFDNTSVDIWGRANVTPALLVDITKMLVVGASHKAEFTNYHVFLYEPGTSSYMYVYSDDNTGTNTDSRHSMELQTLPTQIYGRMYIKLSQPTLSGDILEVGNLINEDLTDYIEIDAGEKVALKMKGSPSDLLAVCGLGVGASAADGDIEISFYVSSDSANNRNAYIRYTNPSIGTTYNEYSPGLITTGVTPILRTFNISPTVVAKKNSDLPWTLTELADLDFMVVNKQVTPGEKVRVYFGFLFLDNMKLKSITNKVPYNGYVKLNYAKPR